MNYTATAHSIDGTLRHEIDVNGRHTIITDEPENLGGTDTAPTPHELLAAALASCVSTMIVLYAQRRGWDFGEARRRRRLQRRHHPQTRRADHPPPMALTTDQINRLEHVWRTCPVRRALQPPSLSRSASYRRLRPRTPPPVD